MARANRLAVVGQRVDVVDTHEQTVGMTRREGAADRQRTLAGDHLFGYEHEINDERWTHQAAIPR
jgi:hypothetical protein